MNESSAFSDQVRQAVRTAGAAWCARILRTQTGWRTESVWGSGTVASLADWIEQPAVAEWLDGSLGSGRVRSRCFKPDGSAPGPLRLTAFPAGQAALLVASSNGGLDASDRSRFKELTRTQPAEVPPRDAWFAGRAGFMSPAGDFDGFDLAELDLENVIRRTVTRARELAGGEGAALAIIDSYSQTIRVLLSELPGRPEERYAAPLGAGLLGAVAATGNARLAQAADVSAAEGSGAHFVAAPVLFKGRVIGALAVGSGDPEGAFSMADARALEELGALAAVLIRNARLFRQMGERIRSQRDAESRMLETARLAAIGEMAAGIAHELNNPLTAISGFTELLLDEFPEGSAQRENMALVLQEARRARTVIRRLLDFSRREEALKTSVNVTALVSEVLALVQPLAQIQHVEVRFEAWEGLPHVYGDPNQLRQVFVNLATNGIQAMPRGGQLEVQAAVEKGQPDQVIIQVRDTGSGIPAEHLGKIFEPFFTTKPVGSGTGLGLSISRNILMDHGGEIFVESEAGRGAVFTVRLPAEEQA